MKIYALSLSFSLFLSLSFLPSTLPAIPLQLSPSILPYNVTYSHRYEQQSNHNSLSYRIWAHLWLHPWDPPLGANCGINLPQNVACSKLQLCNLATLQLVATLQTLQCLTRCWQGRRKAFHFICWRRRNWLRVYRTIDLSADKLSTRACLCLCDYVCVCVCVNFRPCGMPQVVGVKL